MQRLIRFVCLATIVGLGVPAAHARTLREDLRNASQSVGLAGGTSFDALADVIADTAARSIPVVSASAGFTYHFNKDLDIFERTSETLGPILLERPDTLGRSKFNVNVSFQFVRFDAFDGDSIKKLQAPDPIVVKVTSGGALVGFTANQLRYRLKIDDYITAFSLTYGILDDLDVNVLVPVIETNFETGVTSQQVAIAGPDGAFSRAVGPPAFGDVSDDKFGLGDILLRFKYQLPRLSILRWAAGLQLRMPTGYQADFQGVDTFEASPALFASTVLWGRVTPAFNAAIDLRADDVARSQARYSLGADVDVVPRLGLSFAFLGRSEFARSSPAGETSFQHLHGGVTVQEPLLGLDFGRKDFVDFAFGLRGVVWHEVMLFLNGIYAVNDQGLRNQTIIPTIGVEGTF